MVKTESLMSDLEKSMPTFSLQDAHQVRYSESDFQEAKLLVVAFICNHCPFVIHIAKAMGDFARFCESNNVAFLGINSNDAKVYPEDAPSKMLLFAKEHDLDFPYLIDDSQEVAKAFSAVCTPEFFVFNAERKLAYRGRFSNERPQSEVSMVEESLKEAVLSLLEGVAPKLQKPSLGCSIKWKGN